MTQFILPSAFVSVTIVIPPKTFATYITRWVCSPTKLCRQLKLISDCSLETFGERFGSLRPLVSRGKWVLSRNSAPVSRNQQLRNLFSPMRRNFSHWCPYQLQRDYFTEESQSLYTQYKSYKENKGMGSALDVLRDE